MAIDQSIANWAAYQSDPTKAFKDGQWIDASEYVNQFGVKNPTPGFGTINDKEGYFADVGGKPVYQKYAEMYPGIAPTQTGWSSSGDASGAPSSGVSFGPNVAGGMAPQYNPDEGFFEGMFDSIKSSLSEPYLPAMLGFGLGALGGFSGPGDWFSGSGTAGADASWGVNAAKDASSPTFAGRLDLTGGVPNFSPDPSYAITPSGGTMGWEEELAQLLGGGNGAATGGGGLSATDMDWLEGPGSFGADMASGGGGGSISGLTGGGNILTSLAEKVGPTVAKSLFSRFLSGDASALDVLGAAAPGLISEWMKSQQADKLSGSLTKIADEARADRSPFLNYAKSTLAGGPDAYAAGAGSQALKGVLAKLSASFGNPIGAPAALGIATDSALNNWGNDWRQAANIGLGGNYSGLATNAAMAANPSGGGSGYGDAAASVFSAPQNSLADLMKRLNISGLT